MNQHEAPTGYVATIGHPANRILIVKIDQGWRYLHDGAMVDDEAFRGGWDEYRPTTTCQLCGKTIVQTGSEEWVREDPREIDSLVCSQRTRVGKDWPHIPVRDDAAAVAK